jgi:hypothetical protein
MGCCLSMPHLLGKVRVCNNLGFTIKPLCYRVAQFRPCTQPLVYEVRLDNAGVAYRVPNGTGTHLIHINGEQEMFIEEKVGPDLVVLYDMMV